MQIQKLISIAPEKYIPNSRLEKITQLIPYALLGVFVIFFLSTHAPNIDYDSPSYIHFDPVRPLIYPTFIWFFHWMGRFQFEAVVWTQSAMTFSSFMYARYWLKKYCQLPDRLIFFVVLFLLVSVSLHFQMFYLESEGLSFPLFIVTFFTFVECFQKFQLKKIALLAFLSSILVLTRLQFYFLYPVFALLLYRHFLNKTPLKLLFIAFVILIGSIFFTQLIDRGYHYFKHGFFGSAPYSGLITSIQPLYLAGKEAPNFFQNSREKEIVTEIVEKMDQKKLMRSSALLASFKLQYYEYAYEEYTKNYVVIQGIVMNAVKPFSLLEGNKIITDITKTIVLHQFKKNLLFYGWKVIEEFGGVPVFLFYCLILLAILINLGKNRNHYADFTYYFISVGILLTFSNALLVAVAEPNLSGYFCYSQFILYCLAVILADRAFFNEKI